MIHCRQLLASFLSCCPPCIFGSRWDLHRNHLDSLSRNACFAMLKRAIELQNDCIERRREGQMGPPPPSYLRCVWQASLDNGMAQCEAVERAFTDGRL